MNDLSSLATKQQTEQLCGFTRLDLRYVPNGQSFEDREARDTAEEVPANYEAPIFGTAALQHTRPKLTWDADDDDRKKLLAKRVTKDQMREDDFKVRSLAFPVAQAHNKCKVGEQDSPVQIVMLLCTISSDCLARGGEHVHVCRVLQQDMCRPIWGLRVRRRRRWQLWIRKRSATGNSCRWVQQTHIVEGRPGGLKRKRPMPTLTVKRCRPTFPAYHHIELYNAESLERRLRAYCSLTVSILCASNVCSLAQLFLCK